jgi:hypothetical protein
LRLLSDAGLLTSRRAMVDRRRVIYMLHPGYHGQITAWLAGTRIGLDEPHPVFAIRLIEEPPPDADSN